MSHSYLTNRPLTSIPARATDSACPEGLPRMRKAIAIRSGHPRVDTS